jgi:6-phosphogluconolactonase
MISKKMVYVGTYTKDGIYIFDFENGKLIEKGLSDPTINPSYLVQNDDYSILYSVNETAEFNGTNGGGVSAFKIDQETGELTLFNSQKTEGKHPCHLCLVENNLFVANYTEGTISQLPINLDGSIGEISHVYKHVGSGPNKERQEAPHVHFVTHHQTHLCAVDLGIDQILYYRFENNELIKDYNISLKPGSGPRHLAFLNSFTYVVNELSSEVVVIKERNIIQIVSTLPSNFSENSYAAAIKISPDYQFLYVSNRGYDSIAIYKIDELSGMLTLIDIVSTLGVSPRDFSIIDDYLLVCNQQSSSVVSFKIDQKTGQLTSLYSISVPNPVCIKIIELK